MNTIIGFQKTCANKVSVFAVILAVILGLLSIDAWAIFDGVAGEGLLVPFVLYDSKLGTNTVINIKVPEAVGVDIIPNKYTAQHTSPTGSPLPQTNLTVHWTFFDIDGKHLVNGKFNTLPDQVYSFNWSQVLSSIYGLNNPLDAKPGYIVLVTEAGASGFNEATFNMFGDAVMYFGKKIATIPVLAMSDGADGELTSPTPENEVIEGISGPPSWSASPLHSGIRIGTKDPTNPDSNDTTNLVKFDLALAPRVGSNSIIFNLFPSNTLLIVWNDRNNPSWNGVVGEVFNNQGNSCSYPFDLSHHLNLIWVKNAGDSNYSNYVVNTQLCPFSSNGLPGYVEFVAPTVQDAYAAAVGFSIKFNNRFGLLGPSFGSDKELNTVIAHERGRFSD